jgi:hypothetical protein
MVCCGVEADECAGWQDEGEDAGDGGETYGTVTAGSIWWHCTEGVLLQSGVGGEGAFKMGKNFEEMPCRSPADTSRYGARFHWSAIFAGQSHYSAGRRHGTKNK